MTVRVFIADDHAVVREGLRLILEAQTDLTVVGEAESGRQAVREIVRAAPDVVLMDVAMPDLNGIEATRQIAERCPSVKVVVLSMHATSEHVFQAFKAGARGYLVKESAGAEVVEAIRAVQGGRRRFLSARISDTVLDEFARSHAAAAPASPLERLSQREREVVQLVAEGKSSAEIGKALFLSAKTVETYRSRAMAKLGVEDLPALVKLAIQHGLTSLEK